jgi:hypothetical protein
VVGLLAPVVLWRIVTLTTHRDQPFVVKESDWSPGERFTRALFATAQGGCLVMAYNFSSVTPKSKDLLGDSGSADEQRSKQRTKQQPRKQQTRRILHSVKVHNTAARQNLGDLDENRSPVRRRPPCVQTFVQTSNTNRHVVSNFNASNHQCRMTVARPFSAGPRISLTSPPIMMPSSDIDEELTVAVQDPISPATPNTPLPRLPYYADAPHADAPPV